MMRLYNKNSNSLFTHLVLKLSTEEILKLISEFEKLLESQGKYIPEFRFIDDEDKKAKSILFRMYDKNKLSSCDDRMKNIITKNL